MRIRVGVRVHLPEDGSDREGSDEKEMDNDDGSCLQPGGGDRHCSAAFAAGGAAGTTPAAQGSFSPAVPARKTRDLKHTSSGVRHQRRQSIWLDVADFWYFADARQVPTIGSLKQQLLQSLLQGEFAMPPAAAAILSSLTCSSLCCPPHVPRQCSNCCDFFWQHFQMPLCRRMAPTVVLRLQGALLPDNQPLYLIENGDHVELCVSHSSSPPVRSESSRTLKAGAEAYTYVSHSCPLWHPAPFKEGALDAIHMCHDPLTSHIGGTSFLRKSRVAGSCGIRVSGWSRKHCTSGDKLQGKGHFTGGLESQKKRAATPLQQQMAKGRRVQELRTECCHTNRSSLQRKPGELAVRLPAVAPAAGISSTFSTYRRALSTVAKKKAKERAYLSRRRATSVTASTTRTKSRRSSTSSSSGGHGNNSRRSSECGGILKSYATPEGRGRAVGADRSVAVKRNQGSPVPLGCSTGKATSGGPAGAAPAAAEKERRYAADKLASSTKGTHSRIAATAAAPERAKAAATGDYPVTPASVRKASSEKVVHWPDTATAGRPSGVVSIQESSSEEGKSSDTEGDVREARLARQKAKEVSPSGATAAAETQPTLPRKQQQQQQAQQVIGKPRVVTSGTQATDSEDSSSDASSTEDSNSSSSEDDACNGRGTLKGVSRLRGRMPAAVARAAAASATRPAATAYGLQEERETDFTQGRKLDDFAVAGEPAPVRQPQSDRSVRKVGITSSGSQVRATADCSSTCGRAHSAGGAGEAPSVSGQGLHANEKRFSRQQHRGEPQQQQVERQQQQQQQQERRRQPHQLQGEKEHERGASGQLLVFKPCKDLSLATVQRGEWLRVRLLHLVNGMPTLDAWKTVFVEATDVLAGRIKLWELRQRGAAGGAGNSTSGSSSNAGGSRMNAGDDDMLEGECTVHVPFRKTAGNQKGGAGRWYDWSELACVSAAAGAEMAKHSAVTASMGTAVASPSGSAAAAALPAVALALRDGGDNAGKRVTELTTDILDTASAANVAAKSAGSAAEGILPAESLQRSSPLLRYLPRRLLSLRQQTLNGDHAAEREGAAGVTEPVASHSNAKKASGGTAGICLQPDSSEPSSSSSTLQGKSSATLLSAKKADCSSVETVMPNGVPDGGAESACHVVLKQKAAEAPDGATASGGTTRVGDSSTAAREMRCEAASSAGAAGGESQLTAAAAEKAGCSTMEGTISDSPAAARTTTEQSSTNAVGYGGTSTGLSIADREKEQWEALVGGGIEISFNEDEEVLVASHPAAPTAAFHLPLPRDLVQECSRRLEAASHNRKNIRNKEHSSTSASCSSGGHSNTTASAPSAQSNGTGINDVQQVELCTEDPSHQHRGGEGCTDETAVSERNFTAETSTLSSRNGNIKRVVAPEIWKGFDCVKACARRVVGEQLQHTRRALRRQVDYYFSPGNWHKDVYLRSCAVPLTRIRCSNDSATGYRSSRGSSDSLSRCVAENASVNTQENTETAATSRTAGTRSIVTVGDMTASNASSSWGSQKERVGEGNVAVNLDDILTFPRMRGLSRDREFVAWCIRSGGGLQHVELETQGETHWLIRKGAAEATLQHRMATKAAKQ